MRIKMWSSGKKLKYSHTGKLKRLSSRSLSFFVASVMVLTLAGGSGLFQLVNNYLEKQRRTPHALKNEALSPQQLAADIQPGDGKAPKLSKELQDQLKADKDKHERGAPQDRTHVKVLDEERSENRKTWLNKDGSRTQEVSTQATSYKDQNGKWQDVDVSLIKDSSGSWKTKANAWQATFGNSSAGIRLTKNGQTFVMTPVGDNQVDPVVSGTAPDQVVTYRNLWNGVDVTYEVAGSQIKESIILNTKNAPTSFSFNVSGAKVTPKDGQNGIYDLDGEFSGFSLSQAAVRINNGAFISSPDVIQQTYKTGVVTVELSETWYFDQPASAFPITIDPTFVVASGTNAFTSYSNTPNVGCQAGPACPNAVGHDTIGNRDARFGYQVAVPAANLVNREYLVSAALHIEMSTTPIRFTGLEQIKVTRSNCQNGFGCIDAVFGELTGSATTSGDIELADIYRKAVAAGETSPWLLVRGEEGGAADKYKEFDYTKTKVTFVYDSLPTQSLIDNTNTNITVPVDNGISVTAQPTLASTVPTDNDGPGPFRYRYIVGTTKSTIASNPLNVIQSVGNVIAESGQLGLDQPQWVVPDKLLQDGTTYYWQALVWDNYNATPRPWVHSPVYSFKVDLRNGKDSTQAFDSFGPVSVDFATGNVTTSAGSHGISALGGTLSLGLDYNSPLRSRQGLVGDYYNGTAFSGTPILTRVDPNIKFDWAAGSPSTGLVNTDNFVVRWNGYFVAPATGTYQFGTTSDNGSRVYVNDLVTPYLDQWAALPTQVYGSGTVALTAGQVIPIKYELQETTGNAKAEMWVKTTDGTTVTPRVIPSSWLQTGARPIAEPKGLIGRYYTDPGGAHTFPTSIDDPTRLFLTRNDTSLSQSWGAGSPVPGGPADNFMVRWKGQIKVPVSGTYQFGVGSDDGGRVLIGNAQTLVTNAWGDHGASPIVYGSYFLTANTPEPITIEYYENGGNAEFNLYARLTGLSADTPINSSWLSPQAEILPNGWGLSLDGDGTLSYSFASINNGGVTLYDSTGQTHEWKYNGSGFTPPPAETGHMVRGGDGTVTLQDEDGLTYVFAPNGSIKSVTKPADDRNPAALQYIYQAVNNNPARLTQISDPLSQTNINDATTASRWLKVYYGGDTVNCPAAPTGFVAITAHNYACAVKTSDLRVTGFFYTLSGNDTVLGRIVLPGNDTTDYKYSFSTGVDNSSLLSKIRSSLATDAIAAGLRTQDTDEMTEISYDSLKRVSGVKLPAASAGATRLEHTYEYRPASTTTLLHVTNATEPNGFSRKVLYDALYRTVTDTDVANLATQTYWHPSKDLVMDVTDPAGLRSTTIYDYADRATDQYGPAPSAWFDTTNPSPGSSATWASPNSPTATFDRPLTTPTDFTPQVPHSQSVYEENINGLAAAYHEVTTATNGTGSNTKVLFGNPKLHSTGVQGNPANGDVVKNWGATPPITPTSGNGWGVSLTGWLHLTATGSYGFRVNSDDGVRLWIGDSLVTNDWTDGPVRSHPTNVATGSPNSFANTGDKWYRVRLDYYNKSVGSILDTDAQLNLFMTAPGGAETSAIGGLLKPNYGLVTTSKVFDSNAAVSDKTVATSYGTTPELGLAQSSTVDPAGLALTTSSTYETPGAGSFLRQLTSTLPGGETTSYTYYGATETRDNPCTTGTVEAYKQAGLVKLKTEPDPDGAGAQTPITTETVYDDTGRAVATRFNAETSWTCLSYDSRGRLTQRVVPTNVNGSGRTVTYTYAVGGNPFVSDITDPNNSEPIETTVDLLGRTVGYKDTLTLSFVTGSTSTTYDTIGRMVSRSSPKMGLEEFTYDNFNRLTNHKLDSVIYATPSYDAFSRVSQVTYPAAGQQKVVFGRDSLGRVNSRDYTLGNGTTHSVDTVTYSQSGDVVSGTELSQAKSYSYDKAGRLTTASQGTNTYAYSYAAPSATTCSQTSANLNSHKSSNRTSQTVNGTTTTYCYDKADRLIASSDTSLTTPTYDAHGNSSRLGSTSNTKYINFFTDSSDRNIGYRQNGGLDYNVQHNLDAADRVYSRFTRGLASSDIYYGYTTASQSPSFALNINTSVLERYLNLPGGVQLTLKSGTTRLYSLPNLHGDIIQTTNQSGTSQATFSYEPYGKLNGTTIPGNFAGGSAAFAHVGQYQKISEAKFANQPQQMGARVYIPTLGRFTSVDPIYGGTANNYTYPNDPVNDNDLTGMCIGVKWFVRCAEKAQPVIDKGVRWGTTVLRGLFKSKGPAQVTKNQIQGKAAEAARLQQLQRIYGAGNVRSQVYNNTPYGKRFSDFLVSPINRKPFYEELKTGASRYTPDQQLKDQWLEESQGIPTILNRVQ